MNEYDSELVTAILTQAGFGFADSELDADVILLNTCAVRENAQRKVFGLVHAIKHRREGRPAIYGILGCIATHLEKELIDDKKLKIDLVAGPDSYKRLPELIHTAADKHHKAFDVTLSEFETYADVYPKREASVNAWVAVMRGCNNFCTFCVVPYTRGRERSRSPESISEEITRLVQEENVKQVTLLGQNVNSYRFEDTDFADLLNTISKIDGLERIRFMSPHPKDFPDKLLEVMATNNKVCTHIHFPLQAGSNRILELMNRKYTREDFLDQIRNMRARIPRIVITTDIIIGFPTETDKEFEDTVNVINEVQFDAAFIFKYSERKGTIAAKKFKDDVPEEKKTERIVRLNKLQKDITLQKNKAHIGETHTILIEGGGTTDSHADLRGRTNGNKLVILPQGDVPYTIGQSLTVKITDATPHVLKAVISG